MATSLPLTGKALGLSNCPRCHLLLKLDASTATCPRCGNKLSLRKPASLARTWALVLSALIFYIPANLLPMTLMDSLTGQQADTIMSGVIYFVAQGSWPIALVIFIASVFVPIMKLLILIYLLISVQRASPFRPQQRLQLYRLTEWVGRWSMVDVYVVTLLVALVNIKGLASIHPGPAALCFAAVVVLTMLAAMSFEPRYIWDHVLLDGRDQIKIQKKLDDKR